MPAMGKFQGVTKVQIIMVEPPQVNTASNLAPESRKQTPELTPTYNIQNGGRLNSEKEPTCEEPIALLA